MTLRKHALDSEDQSVKISKRPRHGSTERDSYSVSSEDYESDDSWKPKGPKKRVSSNRSKAAKNPAAVKLSSIASIVSLASNVEPGREDAAERLAGVDSAVLGKIRKALALGGHQATGEAEAKRAMRLAAKLMAQHNVDQADILSAEQDSEKLKRAGQSSITVKSTHPDQGLVVHTWSMTVSDAMRVFFDCKCYCEHFRYSDGYAREKIVWTFYGLCEQTVAAAFGFEMVYNLILTWSTQNKNAKGRSAKNTYCHGVADGLLKLALREKKQEERLVLLKEARRIENARAAEEQERKKAIERLLGTHADDIAVKKEPSEDSITTTGVKPETSVQVKVEDVPDEDMHPQTASLANRCDLHDSSDDDSDDSSVDDFNSVNSFEAKPDFEDEGNGQVDWMLHDIGDEKPAISINSAGPVKKEEESPWTSAQQLTKFRNNASTIADDYLKQRNIKPRRFRQRSGPKLNSSEDMRIYNQGRDDAKNIDIKRKRIKDVDED